MKSLTLTGTLLVVSSAALMGSPVAPLGAQSNSGQSTDWHGTVGIVTGSLESHYGSDARRILGLPFIELNYRDRLFIGSSATGGLGGGAEVLFRRGPVKAALGIAGVERRPEDRADALAGMDDRSGGAFGTAGLAIHAGPAKATANTAIGLGRHAGVVQTLGLQLGAPITRRFLASIGGTVMFADHTNMNFDFGVSEEQAARRRALIAAGDGRLRASDTTAFSAKAGFKEVRATLQMAYALRGSWRAIGLVSAGRLARGVSESPLARQRNATTAGAGFAYGW